MNQKPKPKSKRDSLPGKLSVRTYVCLLNAGLTSRRKVREAMRDGKLIPCKTPVYYGIKIHREVCEWLGVSIV